MPWAEALSLAKAASPASRPPSARPGADTSPPPGEAAALHVAVEDPAADRTELLRLAEWCEQFSPLVGLEDGGPHSAPARDLPARERPESLLLDVTGLGRLFGSEMRLVRQVAAAFQQSGYVVRLALADTIGTAWAVSHFGGETSERSARVSDPAETSDRRSLLLSWDKCFVVPPEGSLSALQPLPVEALRLAADTVDLLHQLGIFSIQALLRLPRAGLSSRLGRDVLLRLDQALGTAEEVFVTHRPPPTFSACWSLEYPAAQRAAIEGVLRQLVEQVAQLLAERDRGALQLEIRLDCVPPVSRSSSPASSVPDEQAAALRFRIDLFRPLADAAHLLELVRMQLERTALPGPVRALAVCVPVAAPREPQQQELFGAVDRRQQHELARLVDRLTSRLGRTGVLRPRLLAEAQPEHACRWLPLTSPEASAASSRPADAAAACDAPGPSDRPLQLQHPPRPVQVLAVAPDGPPVRFHDQRRWQQVVQCWGPERIETGWWRGRTVRRDYYRVETSSGQRFWLFRQLDDNRWFLHGTFA